MAGLYDRVYAKSPVWLQNLGVSVYGLVWRQRRYGGSFRRLVTEFAQREQFTVADWRADQIAALRRLLRHAAAEVPYYRRLFAEIGLQPSQIYDFQLEDLQGLPLLEKDALRREPQAFVAACAGRLHAYQTSGTTGTPLTIFSSTETDRAVNAAYEQRVRRWAGVSYRMSRAMLGGRLVVPQAHARAPFWRYNLVERQLYLSAFHISPANAPYYAAALNHYRPDYLVGYASAHYFLARQIEALGIAMYRPHAVLTSSETLTAEMRLTLERVYGCEVFDGYSGVENCCLASECEQHRLHLSPDVGIVELVDAAGRSVGPGEPGEIVATGLLNFDQPLIRYRTGDWAVGDPQTCPCGRSMPVLSELMGRAEDWVVLADGRISASFYKVFQGLAGIQEAQVIQEDYERFTVRIVADDRFTEVQRSALLNNIARRYGPVSVSLQLVAALPRTEGGKFRAVISHVPRPMSGAAADQPDPQMKEYGNPA